MSYFSMFPKINYDFAIKGEQINEHIVPDITRRIKITADVVRNYGAYEKYIVKDGETPEMISYNYYDTVNYYWIIMLVNNIFDAFSDLPQSQYSIEQQSIQKYGETGIYDVHHYEDSYGMQINGVVAGNIIRVFNSVTMQFDTDLVSNYVSVTNYEYEINKNEKNREIYLLKPIYISGVLKESSRLLSI